MMSNVGLSHELRSLVGRALRAARWRLGMQAVAPELEEGTDESIAAFYQGRITDCSFLADPGHYEYPRVRWLLDRVQGGRLLEVGVGNGGMTRLLATRVANLVALDVSTPSLNAVRELGLPNVEVVEVLVERFQPAERFDWIVMSEVLEHLRDPAGVVEGCVGWLAPGGNLLITTPNGHWESNEHLQEFELPRFAAILTASGAEVASVGYLRDDRDRRRWLVGQATAAQSEPAPDQFNDRRAVRHHRRATPL